MKTVTVGAALTFGLIGASALGQVAGDATEKQHACSVMTLPERLECLRKLAEKISPPPARAAIPSAPELLPGSNNWIISETTSPVDYSPVIIATVSSSSGPDGIPLQLSIQCRAGRTDLVFASPALTRRGEDYAFSYVVTDGQPVMVATTTPASGRGVAIKGDVVRLLASLPERGEIAVRIAARDGRPALEGRYPLASLKIMRDRLAIPCRWPAAAGAPRN